MQRRRVLRGLAALAILSSVAVACGDDDDADDEATETPTADEVQSLEVTTEDYKYTEAPDEISAGLVELTLTNDGEVAHEAALVEIGDATIDEFVKDFAPVLDGGPFPDYAEHVAAPVEVEPGDTATVLFTVAEGTYAMMCTLTGDADAAEPAEGEDAEEGDIHFTRGMAQVLEVGPADDDAATELPEGDGSITAKDYSFEADVSAGDTTINFINDGPAQVHFASVSVFPEGTDVATAESSFMGFITAEEGSPPPEGAVESEDIGFSGVFSTGLGSQFTLPGGFQSGRTYLLACFISDRSGGPPHAIGAKMYKAFTVE